MYDYHLAQAMDQMAEHDDSAAVGSIEQVLAKYNLSQADLDSSLSYYSHHIETLREIYDNLNKRYTEEAEAMGIHRVTTSDVFSESGDTTDIWMDARMVALPLAPLGRTMKFIIPSDSSFHQCDHFKLEGFVHFIGRPGEEKKNGISLGMTVFYENDTIQTSVRAVNGNQRFNLELRCDSLYNIQSVNGYISIVGKSSSPVILEDLRLLKIHRDYLFESKDSTDVSALDQKTMTSLN
ncbi:MAG: DUF4296 domain-containing protein [Bacteroidaceae bacterium]|nr:DUF4296 domain-containing protein [Bacteroidaceae bacterium]